MKKNFLSSSEKEIIKKYFFTIPPMGKIIDIQRTVTHKKVYIKF